MRAVVQRVDQAHVEVAAKTVGKIDKGLLVYLGIGKSDGEAQVAWMASKIAGLRIFPDERDRMTLSVLDVQGQLLVVSQFTLYGDVRKGRRPSFDGAASPEHALLLYQGVCAELETLGLTVKTGRFREQMMVHAAVNGPVTILVDSEGAL